MNLAERLIYERHEVRRAILPRYGFEIPKLPDSSLLEQAKAYGYHVVEKRLVERKAQRERHSLALDEMDRLRVPDSLQFDWLLANRPDAMPVGIGGGGGAASYSILNCAAPTTAAPVKQPTATAIRTMMQIRTGVGISCRIFEWGCSFDGSAAATPGQIELFETTVAATMSTAYLTADIMNFGNSTGPLQNATANVPIDITGTSTSGFATAAVTEGTVANYRAFDSQLIAPTGQYVKQWPLGREPDLKAQNYTRARVTFGTGVNMQCYLLVEV